MTDNLKYHSEEKLVSNDGKVFHGFFTRQGGVSSGGYEGLNCGVGSDDVPENVASNRILVAAEASVSAQNLLSLYQVHSADVLVVNDVWDMKDRPKADGFVTDKAGIGLGILTADCGPVLFYGQKKDGAPVIGAAHAGWKGALSGVLEQTVKQMADLGAEVDSIKACVGPCISKSSYEVSESFIEPFLADNEESERFFSAAQKQGHAMFDLSGYCAWRLSRAGLTNVFLMDIDTYSQENEFYSYRRCTHRGEPDYGRQISVISITS